MPTSMMHGTVDLSSLPGNRYRQNELNNEVKSFDIYVILIDRIDKFLYVIVLICE